MQNVNKFEIKQIKSKDTKVQEYHILRKLIEFLNKWGEESNYNEISKNKPNNTKYKQNCVFESSRTFNLICDLVRL